MVIKFTFAVYKTCEIAWRNGEKHKSEVRIRYALFQLTVNSKRIPYKSDFVFRLLPSYCQTLPFFDCMRLLWPEKLNGFLTVDKSAKVIRFQFGANQGRRDYLGCEFLGPKCAVFWVLKSTLGEIIWGLIFLCPQTLTSSLKILGEQLIIPGL